MKQERLAEKLKQIRLALGLSQTEMLYRLGVEDLITYHQISRYETGTREPPLRILLEYARVAGGFVGNVIFYKKGGAPGVAGEGEGKKKQTVFCGHKQPPHNQKKVVGGLYFSYIRERQR